MSYSLKQNDNITTILFEISAEDFSHEVEKEIFSSKDKLNLSVYRDGEVPPEVMQQIYDGDELINRVVNTVVGEEYEKVVKEKNIISLIPPVAKITNCKKGEPFIFTVDTILTPEIELGTYIGVEVKKPDLEVSEEAVEKLIENFLKQNCIKTEITDRGVLEGDHLLIDFEGFLHGRSFDGNKANNFPLVVGSHTFIPGFEEQLIGVGLNEAKDFTITYPEDYRVENLAGQDVVFRCIVRKITSIQLPELTDDLIKEKTEFENVDAFKENIHKNLSFQKCVIELNKKENAILKEIVTSSNVETIPQLVEQELHKYDFEMNMQFQNNKITFEEHLRRARLTREQFEQQRQLIAQNRCKTRLVLMAIAQKEGIDVTEEDIENEIKALVEKTKKAEDVFRHPFKLSQMRTEIILRKAQRFVIDHCKEID